MGTTTVSPALPGWVENTFEYEFLSRMIRAYPGGGEIGFGGPVWYDGDRDSFKVAKSELREWIEKGRDGSTDLRAKLVPVLEAALNANPALGYVRLSFNDLSAEVAFEGPDTSLEVDHVLYSLCQRYPEEIPYVETAWAYGDRKPAHGNFGGGASFITPEGINTMTTHGYLKQMREAHELGRKTAPAPSGPTLR